MRQESAEQFAASRRQSGCSDHYIGQCRKIVGDLAKAFPDQTLPDLRTAELDAWLGGVPFAAKTKNGMRIILVACGNWAEGRGYLVKDKLHRRLAVMKTKDATHRTISVARRYFII
jgi:hypothetical protein